MLRQLPQDPQHGVISIQSLSFRGRLLALSTRRTGGRRQYPRYQ